MELTFKNSNGFADTLQGSVSIAFGIVGTKLADWAPQES